MFKGVPKSESTKQNMKGRSGTWIRDDVHNQRMIGENNPGYGKTGSLNVMNNLETRKKVSESKVGRKRIYRENGSHYYERKSHELAS